MRTGKIILLALMAVLVADSAHARPLDYVSTILQRCVDDAGLVDYAALKKDHSELDLALQTIAAEDPDFYASRDDHEKLAFWINAYNVLTLKLIVDHYPIQPATGRQKYPANSIQQIPNAWTGARFNVMGTERTLDEIEHKIIRAQFKEPRVHFALVCAAMSCPPLRSDSYFGAKLDAQLDAQARRFFSDLRNLHVDREKNEVWVSRIIQWFADDFAPDAAQKDPRDVAERKAVLAAVTPYVDAETKAYLETATYTLHFFEYDWTLNEQAK